MLIRDSRPKALVPKVPYQATFETPPRPTVGKTLHRKQSMTVHGLRACPPYSYIGQGARHMTAISLQGLLIGPAQGSSVVSMNQRLAPSVAVSLHFRRRR